jgi:hypothetical protein
MSNVDDSSDLAFGRACTALLGSLNDACAAGGSLGLDTYVEVSDKVAIAHGLHPDDLRLEFQRRYGDQFSVVLASNAAPTY